MREIALGKFGPHNLAAGQPLAHLQEVLVPVYLHHRYQAEAAAKLIGGVMYDYEVWEGAEPRGQRPVSPDLQREALELLLDGLEPSFLELRPSLRALLLPRPLGSARNREMFLGSTDPVFDPVSVAATAADTAAETVAALESALQRALEAGA